MCKSNLVLVSLLSAASIALLQAHGQATGRPSDNGVSQEESSAISLPVAHLSLSAGKPAPGVSRSAVIVQPVECTSKGDVVLQIPHPPDFSAINVVALNLGGSRTFDLSTVPKLNDIRLLSVSPGDDGEVFLVVATADSAQSDVKMQTAQGKVISRKVWQGEHHGYLVLFGLDGAYQSTIDLPSKFDYRKAAALPSGEFLLLGYDSVNRIPRLQLVNAGGQLVRDLELPAAFLSDETLKKGEEGSEWDTVTAAASLGTLWQFAFVQGKAILYKPHTKASVLEVGAGGSVREEPIAAPSGYELDAFLQSNSRWLARFRRVDLKKSAEGTFDTSAPANNYLLVELDPVDGSVKRTFDLAKDSLFDLACEVDNSLKSYSVDLGSQFLISSTDLPR
jgi:hypothetical protein